MSKFELKVGCDPEFFLWDSITRQHVSAHDLVPGTKDNPHPLDKGAVQVDGLAVEFNIHPATTEDEFVDNVTTVLKQIREMIPERYEFHFIPYAEFREEYYKKLPEKVKEIGCVPDLIAYQERRGVLLADRGRSAAGHIHVGWTENMDVEDEGHKQACVMLVRELDYFLGRDLTLSNIKGFRLEQNRRVSYGRAGCYRVKSYGVEYRTPSNFWVTNEKLMRFVFSQTVAVFNNMMKGNAYNQQEFHSKYSVDGTFNANWINRPVANFGASSADRVPLHTINNYISSGTPREGYATNHYWNDLMKESLDKAKPVLTEIGKSSDPELTRVYHNLMTALNTTVREA